MREADAQRLAEAIRRDFPEVKPGTDFIWTAPPPVKVIDCVLSLNRNYDRVVLKRVRKFATDFPDVKTCTDLRRLIDGYASPAAFLKETLDMNDAQRAATLQGVLDFVLSVQPPLEDATEGERLRQWAASARPGDYLGVGVKGFGLAGFQYLRMLFGAETIKPDVRIKNYISNVLGCKVSDVQAVFLLERAAKIAHKPPRWLDVAIWERDDR